MAEVRLDWAVRARQIVEFRSTHGAWPRVNTGGDDERQLGRWLRALRVSQEFQSQDSKLAGRSVLDGDVAATGWRDGTRRRPTRNT